MAKHGPGRNRPLTCHEQEVIYDAIVSFRKEVEEHPQFYFWTNTDELDVLLLQQDNRVQAARSKEKKKNAE